MRTIGYALFFVLLLLLVAAAGRWAWQSLDRQELAAFLSGQLEGAQPSNTFLQQGDNWLEFQLSGNGSRVHVVSTGSVRREQEPDKDRDWSYAFDYQLLDGAGKLLREGVYHHRTHITHYRDPDHGGIVTRSFLLDPQQIPVDGRRMVVPISKGERPGQLRLRVNHTDPVFLDIMFRVYEKETLATHKLDYRWQRLSEQGKQVLARGSVYGPEHLRFKEQRNLLHARWRPLGPSGVMGDDYRSRKLYVEQKVPGEPVDEEMLPQGMYVDRHSRGVIPLPEEGGRIRLQWLQVAAPAALPGEHLELRWYGRNLGQRAQSHVPLADLADGLEADYGAGMLEVISPVPVVVRVFLEVEGEAEGVEITPEPMRLRSYSPAESMPLVYKLDHAGEQLTPLRVDVRSLLTPLESAPGPVHFEILDAAGVSLESGVMRQDPTPSPYDHLSTVEPGVRLSEAARNYFKLPAVAAEMRIWNTGAGGALVNAYTRPHDLRRELRYPEDHVQVLLDPQQEMRQPAWFVLQPANEKDFQEKLLTQYLQLQNRPPQDDPHLLAGEFAWEEYQPDGQWSGRHLLLPREGSLPVRELSRGAVYRELPANREVSAVLRDFSGHRELRPSLIFQREREQPLAVTVLLDGEPWYDTRIRGRSGQLLLPVVAPGKHRIKVQGSDKVRWFINYLDDDGPSYVRRLAVRIGRDGLEFHYKKKTAEAEVLTGQLYQSDSERLRLHVDIGHEAGAQLQPLAESSFMQRLYDLRTEDTSRVMVLNTDAGTVDGGRRFFIPLGSDLPPGDYRISIRSEREAQAYLALYRLLPGKQQQRAFLRERGDAG